MRSWLRLLPVVLLSLVLVGCSDSDPEEQARVAATAVPEIALPDGELRDLVPATKDLPPGMVPIVAGSGSRDLAAIAEYSADPAKARALLSEHGFTAAYTGQYADPQTGRVLSVVVTRFATAAGAEADLTGDLQASTGEVLPGAPIGEQSEVRRQPLPAASPSPGSTPTAGELVTVRFRQGALTWLVAYGSSPTADPEVAREVAQRLVDKATAAA